MGLSYCTETSAADWIVGSRAPWHRLVTFGPPVFEAYARLRFIPDPSRPGQAEADVDVPDDHLSDFAQARLALRRLARFTDTPGDCYFCAWDGYSDIEFPPAVRDGRMVDLTHRRYAMLRGSLGDTDDWEKSLGSEGPCPPPALVWPADHRWCFASDVDPHWAGIGAEQAAVDALVDDSRLDVVSARADDVHPAYG
ncbi:hypothetical protein [Actinophytocola gossypii]|uniref:DUF2716 domain-containing protein n=1 Tax=Actinophytocola gossypii TaxID=2812003 RepID=A0ABT2JK66_9PSEU|nr:hypothetical protein [Actinophytocola gossypii]MCT2588278.1 hypothetical protein [Actinophytocola gossypii]